MERNIVNDMKLMVVDGNSILNRAFYGLKGSQLLATSDGLYTNAVYGFINILNKYMDEETPDYLCVAFDMKAPTFRHKEFDGYKAKRKGMPEELAVQLPVIKEVLDAMNIKRLEFEGYEADDIIGSISLCAEKRGMNVIIITGDRDALQLASQSTRIKIPTNRSGRAETDEYDYDRVVERFGVTPAQLIDVKGLMGDQSDNIPGVPGVGEKTASRLISTFESIETLYENIDKISKKGVKEKLLAGRDLAFMSKKLATIEREIPQVCIMDMGTFKIDSVDETRLYEIFKRLEFKSFIEKFNLSPKHQKEAPADSYTVAVDCIRQADELEKLKTDIFLHNELAVSYHIDKTGGFATKLTGLSLTWQIGKSVYIDFNQCIDEDLFLASFKEVLENADIKKYGHDMKNFILYLRSKGIMLKGLCFDTMIGAYIINPSKETYTVAELTEEYLKSSIEPVEQLCGKGRSFTPYKDIPVERLSPVAGTHSESIFRLWKILDRVIHESAQDELYYTIELPLVEVLADMEYHGFKVNVDGLKALSLELEAIIERLTGEIYMLAGEEFNINSPKQLGVILFEKLNLPVIKKTKTGYSTNAEVLEKLAPMHEIVSRILEYRQMVKLKSTYAEGLLNVINPDTGRIHSSFNQTVTATGRISSTEPNLQNIPIKLEMGREIRKVFVPESENFILVDADYSQIELRVLAHITNDENMITAFINNEDIHTSTASKVFGVPKENVTSLMRSRAKAVNFGIVYGIGDFSLAKDLGVTRKEAKRYIDEYLDKYPEVRRYMHDTVEFGKQNGFVATLFNRRRYLPELKSSNFNIRSFGERVAMNTPIQGSAADIIKIAMVKVYKELAKRNLKSRLILQVHDELIIETFEDEKELVVEILKDSMENAVTLSVPLRVDVKTGNSWYETK
jgi:DNA polymerase-1